MKNKLVHFSIIGIFISLYALVATISMINSVEFFDISHNRIMSWVLALGFELGAAASLAAILILDKTNKVMVWGLFILLTSFQMMANSYHAYINLENYIPWIELFGLTEEDLITQKRILSIISGAILPIVALGFIKSLTDYIKPTENLNKEENLFDLPDSEFHASVLSNEDIWLHRHIFSKLPPSESMSGYFIEIGAVHGMDISNSYFFEKRYVPFI